MAVIGGAGGGIKSIQRGTTTGSTNDGTTTATINAVDLAKSWVISSVKSGSCYTAPGYYYGAYGVGGNPVSGVELSATTTVQFHGGRVQTTSGVNNPVIYWEVIEYE